MSYDIYLRDPVSNEILQLDSPHHMRGGTYQVGGTTDASLNITYNYAKYFRWVFNDEKGIRKLYGMTGEGSIPALKEAISLLNDDVSGNYWESTEGNAKRSLIQLLTLAKLRPDGIWDGD